MLTDKKIPNIKLKFSGLITVLVFFILVVAGINGRSKNNIELNKWTAKQAIPTVSVSFPYRTENSLNLELPGRLEAYVHAFIYARVSGYLKYWTTDIGASVEAGQVLGEIDTPDLDQQLLQAEADFASAESNAELAASTAKRWKDMLVSDSVSHQEVDDKIGDFVSKQALAKSAKANVERILAMKGFAKILAPFSGTLTVRNIDKGTLINSGAGTGPALFEISDTHRLRLHVNVPQNYANDIKRGNKATITVPESPETTYTAIVESTSGAIDIASDTILVQFTIENPSKKLLPGAFANVSLNLPKNKSVFTVPASSLIFNQSGLHIATVNSENKVTLKTITIAHDLGKTIELSSGVSSDDEVIENPPDGIANGDLVKIAKASSKAKV